MIQGFRTLGVDATSGIAGGSSTVLMVAVVTAVDG